MPWPWLPAASRLRQAGRKATRAERLPAKRGRRAKIAAPGVGAAANYGAHIAGIAPGALRPAVGASVKTMGLARWRAHPYLVLALHPREKPALFDMLAAPLYRFVADWWLTLQASPPPGILSPPALGEAYHAANALWEQPRSEGGRGDVSRRVVCDRRPCRPRRSSPRPGALGLGLPHLGQALGLHDGHGGIGGIGSSRLAGGDPCQHNLSRQ